MKAIAISLLSFLLLACGMAAQSTPAATIQNLKAEIQKLDLEIQTLVARVAAQKVTEGQSVAGNIQPHSIELTLQCQQLEMLRMRKGMLTHEIELWRLREQLEEVKKQSPPIGTVIMIAADRIPKGYLLCDGRAVSRERYKALFEVIGTTWGAGDHSTTFNLPEMRGEFVRFLDKGRQVDPGRILGQWQNWTTAMPKNRFKTTTDGQHTHGMTAAGAHRHDVVGYYAWDSTPASIGSCVAVTLDRQNHGGLIRGVGNHTHTIEDNGQHTHQINGGDNETRPRNQALVGCIKY